MTELPNTEAVACSSCFADHGLRLDAEQIGTEDDAPCPQCGGTTGAKLSLRALAALAHRFFVWGSLYRSEYGATPLIQFNDRQKTSIEVSPWLTKDVEVFERLLGIGFFHYGPRLWMVGEVEPLKALQGTGSQQAVIRRILSEYPSRILTPRDHFYRIRKGLTDGADPSQYDSPPPDLAGNGRLDSLGAPVLYASTDLQICVHECRVTAEDEVYVATLRPRRDLKLLDLSVLLKEDGVTEFESLDMAVHMLFLAGPHAYPISRAIAAAARSEGLDGIIYSSYFSLLRYGAMPFPTTFGLSHRHVPQYQELEQAAAVPNLAIFGRPLECGDVETICINKLILSRVAYDFHFGPVTF